MRNLLKFSKKMGLVCLASSMGFVACGDDKKEDPTTTTDTTTTEDTTTTTDATNEVQEEVTVTDPCDPNPCGTKSNTCNAENTAIVSYTAVCTDNEGEAVCSNEVDTTTDCGENEVCALAECVASGDPCSLSFSNDASLVSHIAIAEPSGDSVCCFDFNDDGTIDNKLGSLITIISSIGVDVNDTLKTQLESGAVSLILEYMGLDDATTDSELSINGFYGADTDGDYADNLAGTGSFTISPDSFKAGTSDPYIKFETAAITAGVLATQPDLFRLSIPILDGVVLDLAIQQTRLEGVVTAGSNGGLFMDGTEVDADGNTLGAQLGGLIHREDLYNALNTFVAGCSCLDLSATAEGKLISFDSETQACASTSDVDSTGCGTTGLDSACVQIVNFCGTALTVLSPDIDTDEDAKNDSLSIGAWVKGVPTSIVGVDGCNSPQ